MNINNFTCPFCGHNLESISGIQEIFIECPACWKQVKIPDDSEIEFDTEVEDVWETEKINARNNKLTFWILTIASIGLYGGLRTIIFDGPGPPLVPVISSTALSFLASKIFVPKQMSEGDQVLGYILWPVIITAITLLIAYVTSINLVVGTAQQGV
jgi:hypothetical protein